MVQIDGLRWTEQNEAHCAEHGVWPDDLDWILHTGDYSIIPNRKNMAASYLLIGRRRDGAPITAALRETEQPGIWYPVSAWHWKGHELQFVD